MLKHLRIHLLILFSLIVVSVEFSNGQAYPTKPIEIINPYTPGSPTDITARLIADIAPKYLGQPLVVVNRPGAGGSVGAAEVISSKPDGYKLFHTTNFFFAMTTKTQKIPFDPGQLTPLANFRQLVEGLCVKSDSPWKTFNDLVDYGKKNPGKLSWAHTGRGALGHIAILLLLRRAGVETTDIPYKGTPEKVTALLGGHIDASSMTYGAVRDHVKSGKVRFLAFVCDRRYSGELSNVPTAVDLGFPDVARLSSFAGFYIHKDTPGAIQKTLFDAFKKTYEDPKFKQGIEELGDLPRFEGPEVMKESIKRGEEMAVPILKELKLYVGP